MRVLIFHGYLLGGTGSNVYNARLASALVDLGHEVHLLCQDRHPGAHAFVDACGDWEAGELRIHALRPPISGRTARCTVYRPDVGPLLPVYVADRYDGIEARPFPECTGEEIARYIDANVAAVREVAALVGPDVALANHLVMGPVILARGLGSAEGASVPYAAKVHGSALEYTVKPYPERFLPYAREGLAGARGVLVGSRHTAESLWRALEGDGEGSDGEKVSELRSRTRLGPPGVDIERFVPRDAGEAAAGLRELIADLRSAGGEARSPESAASAFVRDDRAAADALARLRPDRDRLVGFVGKLIVNKGVDLLLAAWPLVLRQVPDARLVVVGFGEDRQLMERLLGALAGGDLEQAHELARPHLRAFVESLSDERSESRLRELSGSHGSRESRKSRASREDYLIAARALPERVVLTGRLDHEELARLLPVCEALVVPSTFPEAFGMVAVEAAACGALPISAAHSGLAEVSTVLARAVPAEVAPLLSFPVDDCTVAALAERIVAWLGVDPAVRAQTRAGLVKTVRERWSWQGVARGVIAAALGELDGLPIP